MDRVQIVAYLPEYYADFIHLFRQGWWENVPGAMIQGITRKKFLAFILSASCILATDMITFTVLVLSLILARISSVYFCYFKYSKLHLATDLKDEELKFYTNSPNILLVAKLVETQKIIGSISYVEMDKTTVKMSRLNVHSDFRGLKIGWKLVGELMLQAKANGYIKMYIKTSSPNLAAQRLYTKMGFQQLDQQLCFENTIVDVCSGLYDIAYIKHLYLTTRIQQLNLVK